uniref:Zinc finger protein 418 n=1 Tax=Cacopsylla melanoneura TaxID=428564 RepID=A0A8D8X842_9HEMI
MNNEILVFLQKRKEKTRLDFGRKEKKYLERNKFSHDIIPFGLISGRKLKLISPKLNLKSQKIDNNTKHCKSERQYYICTFRDCFKMLKTKSAFERHIEVSHTLLQEKNNTNGSKPTYSCKLCDYRTHMRGNLFVHQRKHTKIRPYHCKLCTQTYAHRTNLRNHIISSHWNLKQYACSVCTLSFSLNSYLKQHLVKHKVDKPFKCKACNKTYKFKGTLYKHVKQHDLNKAYCCQFCTKIIKSQLDFQKHLKTHSRIQCPVCNRSILGKTNFNIHLRIHRQERPLHCFACNDSFAQLSTLVNHERIHLDYKPYKCHYCNYSARTYSSRRVHEQTHHQDILYKCDIRSCLFETKFYSCLHRHRKIFHSNQSVYYRKRLDYFLHRYNISHSFYTTNVQNDGKT